MALQPPDTAPQPTRGPPRGGAGWFSCWARPPGTLTLIERPLTLVCGSLCREVSPPAPRLICGARSPCSNEDSCTTPRLSRLSTSTSTSTAVGDSSEEEESSRPKGPTHTERLAKLTRTRSQSAPPVYRGPSRREVTGQAGVPKDPPLPLDVPLRQGRASARPMSSRRRRREARRRRPACI